MTLMVIFPFLWDVTWRSIPQERKPQTQRCESLLSLITLMFSVLRHGFSFPYRQQRLLFVLITNLTCFLMCLFHFSTCFEQPSAHHQENQLYQCIIWYISLCVGDRVVCRSLTCIPHRHLDKVICTR